MDEATIHEPEKKKTEHEDDAAAKILLSGPTEGFREGTGKGADVDQPPVSAPDKLKVDALSDVERYDVDAGAIASHRTTSGGGLLVHANFTRTGVFHYPQPDGSVRRELRHPDEVFDRDSLASMADVAATVYHPKRVDPSNWKDESVGHVIDAPKRDGRFAAGDIAIEHGPAIDDIKSGRLRELSMGYTCKLDPTPGTFQGEKYDAIQRRIRYNHAALLPRGEGRAGPEVGLHLDGTTSGTTKRSSEARGGDSYVAAPMDVAELQKRLDALETETQKLKTDLTASQSKVTDLTTQLDAAKRADGAAKVEATELEKLRADNQRLAGENTAFRQAQQSSDKTRADAQEQAQFEAAVAERVALQADAKRVLGDRWDSAGKTNAAIKREVLAKLQPKIVLDGKDANFVEGLYTATISGQKVARDRTDSLAFLGAPHITQDGKPKTAKAMGQDEDDEAVENDDTKKAYDAMVDRDKNAWMKKKTDRAGKAAH